MDTFDLMTMRGLDARNVLKATLDEIDTSVPFIHMCGCSGKVKLYADGDTQHPHYNNGNGIVLYLETHVLAMMDKRDENDTHIMDVCDSGYFNICLQEVPDITFTCQNKQCLVFAKHRSWPIHDFILIPDLFTISGAIYPNLINDSLEFSAKQGKVSTLSSYDALQPESMRLNEQSAYICDKIAQHYPFMEPQVLVKHAKDPNLDLFTLPGLTSNIRKSFTAAFQRDAIFKNRYVLLTDSTRILAPMILKSNSILILCKELQEYIFFYDQFLWDNIHFINVRHMDELKSRVEAFEQNPNRMSLLLMNASLHAQQFTKPLLVVAFFKAMFTRKSA